MRFVKTKAGQRLELSICNNGIILLGAGGSDAQSYRHSLLEFRNFLVTLTQSYDELLEIIQKKVQMIALQGELPPQLMRRRMIDWQIVQIEVLLHQALFLKRKNISSSHSSLNTARLLAIPMMNRLHSESDATSGLQKVERFMYAYLALSLERNLALITMSFDKNVSLLEEPYSLEPFFKEETLLERYKKVHTLFQESETESFKLIKEGEQDEVLEFKNFFLPNINNNINQIAKLYPYAVIRLLPTNGFILGACVTHRAQILNYHQNLKSEAKIDEIIAVAKNKIPDERFEKRIRIDYSLLLKHALIEKLQLHQHKPTDLLVSFSLRDEIMEHASQLNELIKSTVNTLKLPEGIDVYLTYLNELSELAEVINSSIRGSLLGSAEEEHFFRVNNLINFLINQMRRIAQSEKHRTIWTLSSAGHLQKHQIYAFIESQVAPVIEMATKTFGNLINLFILDESNVMLAHALSNNKVTYAKALAVANTVVRNSTVAQIEYHYLLSKLTNPEQQSYSHMNDALSLFLNLDVSDLPENSQVLLQIYHLELLNYLMVGEFKKEFIEGVKILAKIRVVYTALTNTTILNAPTSESDFIASYQAGELNNDHLALNDHFFIVKNALISNLKIILPLYKAGEKKIQAQLKAKAQEEIKKLQVPAPKPAKIKAMQKSPMEMKLESAQQLVIQLGEEALNSKNKITRFLALIERYDALKTIEVARMVLAARESLKDSFPKGQWPLFARLPLMITHLTLVNKLVHRVAEHERQLTMCHAAEDGYHSCPETEDVPQPVIVVPSSVQDKAPEISSVVETQSSQQTEIREISTPVEVLAPTKAKTPELVSVAEAPTLAHLSPSITIAEQLELAASPEIFHSASNSSSNSFSSASSSQTHQQVPMNPFNHLCIGLGLLKSGNMVYAWPMLYNVLSYLLGQSQQRVRYELQFFDRAMMGGEVSRQCTFYLELLPTPIYRLSEYDLWNIYSTYAYIYTFHMMTSGEMVAREINVCLSMQMVEWGRQSLAVVLQPVFEAATEYRIDPSNIPWQ